MKSKNPLLELKNICYNLETKSGKRKKVLKDISFPINKGEFIGITGKSGAGKTTLLKIIAGLTSPSKGRMLNFGKAPKITIVFEDSCLFPWLTVTENIQLGLQSNYLSPKEAQNKVEQVIDLIGLAEYTDSYPKELSAGMKQRVNFARAIVSEPDILLMDDPFVSLDILTADSLRNDLFDFLNHKLVSIQAMVMVTHNIQDLMQLCSSILIMKNTPTELYANVPLELPFPRNDNSKHYTKTVDKIYSYLSEDTDYSEKGKTLSIHNKYLKLSNIHLPDLQRFLEILTKKYPDGIEEHQLIKAIGNTESDFVVVLEFATMLDFAKKKDGLIHIMAFGKTLASEKEEEKRQQLFGKQLIKKMPIVKQLLYRDKTSGRRKIKSIIEKSLTHTQTLKTADAIIKWARFGKII